MGTPEKSRQRVKLLAKSIADEFKKPLAVDISAEGNAKWIEDLLNANRMNDFYMMPRADEYGVFKIPFAMGIGVEWIRQMVDKVILTEIDQDRDPEELLKLRIYMPFDNVGRVVFVFKVVETMPTYYGWILDKIYDATKHPVH